MGLPIILAAAGIGGLLNSLGNSERRREEELRVENAQNLLKKSKTSVGDLALGESRINRFYGASLTNVLNQSALQTRGIINSPVVGAAAAGQIAGQQAQSLFNYNESVNQRNQAIDSQIAGLELNKPTGSAIEDFFGGAVAGAEVGMQISSLLPEPTKIPVPSHNNIPNIDSILPQGKPEHISPIELPKNQTLSMDRPIIKTKITPIKNNIHKPSSTNSNVDNVNEITNPITNPKDGLFRDFVNEKIPFNKGITDSVKPYTFTPTLDKQLVPESKGREFQTLENSQYRPYTPIEMFRGATSLLDDILGLGSKKYSKKVQPAWMDQLQGN